MKVQDLTVKLNLETDLDGDKIDIDHIRDLLDAEREGRLWILPEGLTVKLLNHIMGLSERVRAMRVSKGEEDLPIVTWQLYNALVEQAEAEAALAEKVGV